jgi:hypothetical protein
MKFSVIVVHAKIVRRLFNHFLFILNYLFAILGHGILCELNLSYLALRQSIILNLTQFPLLHREAQIKCTWPTVCKIFSKTETIDHITPAHVHAKVRPQIKGNNFNIPYSAFLSTDGTYRLDCPKASLINLLLGGRQFLVSHSNG